MLQLVSVLILSLVALIVFLFLCYKAGPAAWGVIFIVCAAIVGALYRSCAMQ